jgi:dTDP-4-amino-4,6-dideoxygalactose transaminase
MKVPLLDLKAQFKTIEKDIRQAIEGSLQSQMFILGETVREFEKKIAAYCEVKYAYGCASGSDAILLALEALGVGKGDEVITSPFSFFSTASYICRIGAKPVFADIDPRTFNIDPGSVEGAVTEKTKAILPVHLFGQCADMGGIMAVAERHNIPVVEDAAQAIGARYNGKPAGSIGAAGAFSFYPTKNLSCYGDGGLMTTSDGALAGKLDWLRRHGETGKNRHTILGINSRLDAIQAAVLTAKLPYLDKWNENRRANALLYNELFRQAEIDPELVKVPYSIEEENEAHRHVYHLYTLRVHNRDNLSAFLQKKEIGHLIAYPIPLYLQPCFAFLGYKKDLRPETEKAAEEVISLPIYPELKTEQIEAVVDAIAEFYG